MRWKNILGKLALGLMLGAGAGCAKQCFLQECDYNHYAQLTGVACLETKTTEQLQPTSVVHNAKMPSTIFDPERTPRYLSLAEAISMALEHGTVGSQNVLNTGGNAGGVEANDSLISFNGAGVGPSDSIRVLAFDPAVAGNQIEASLSRFDAVFNTSMIWNVTDRPIGTALDAFQAGRAGALNAIQTDGAQFSTGIFKPLPTGGVAGVTFNTQYQFTNLPARVNPSYTTNLQFQFEQPLLQAFGVEINQIRAGFPGSQLSPQAFQFLAGQNFEGILISRIRFDQSRAEFERNVNFMLLNVEIAYWNLYGAYWNLYARELGLRLAYESWKITGAKFYGGNAKLANFARTRGQYELFRGLRIAALGNVLESERQLRKLIGLPAGDDCRLVPSDTPTLAPYNPDYHRSLEEALTLRPELVLAREQIKISQLNLIEAKNALLPDLRLTATYGLNGIGNRLDGSGAGNALRNLIENNFNSWELGLRLNVPIGFRAAHAQVRRQRLDLARNFAVLVDQELKTNDFLALQYRRLFEFHEQIRAQRAQREAYGLQLRLESERIGEQITADDTVILEAQRFYTDALANEFNAVVQYNNVLAGFEFAKGTLLHHNNVVIAEGGLPCCASERAVEHFKRRNAALVMHERAMPVHCPGGETAEPLALPHLPKDSVISIPRLFENAPKPPTAPFEQLPPPKPADRLPAGVAPRDSVPAPPGPALPASGGHPAAVGAPPPPPGPGGPSTPPARPEPFGASPILEPSVRTRDSAPSLAPSSAQAPFSSPLPR